MARLISTAFGNGWRPDSERHAPGSVPVLDVAEDTHALVADAHEAALDPDDDATMLDGARVLLDNPRPVDGSVGPVMCVVGGSTLYEAATEVIGAFAQLGLDMPGWVASTDDELAQVLAEHYTVSGYSTCDVMPIEEVIA